MPLHRELLRKDLNRLAELTWKKIETGDRSGLTFREDSITDHNLWELSQAHPDLHVYRYNQVQERTSGADWEWWIGSHQDGWLCLRIQAKRVHKASYPELGHAGRGDSDFQYDTLIESCDEKSGEYPMHVFFNGWHQGRFKQGTYWAWPAAWRACPNGRGPDDCSHASPQHYGCAIASSHAVKRAHEGGKRNTRMVTKHLSNALPWSYLLGYPAAAEPTSAEWLDHVQATIEALDSRRAPDETSRRLKIEEVAVDRSKRRERLPYYVDLVRGNDISPEWDLPDEAQPRARLTIVLDLGTLAWSDHPDNRWR